MGRGSMKTGAMQTDQTKLLLELTPTCTVAHLYPGWPKFKESIHDSELSRTMS